jgi:hypothetical protein
MKTFLLIAAGALIVAVAIWPDFFVSLYNIQAGVWQRRSAR